MCLALHSGKDAGDEAALNKGNTLGCLPVKPLLPKDQIVTRLEKPHSLTSGSRIPATRQHNGPKTYDFPESRFGIRLSGADR